MANYIVHKAVAPDKVKKKHQLTLFGYGLCYLAQLKYDGCCACMVLFPNGTAITYSRTGETVRSMEHVERAMMHRFKREITEFRGIVLIGEAWTRGKDFATISGDFRRHSNSPDLELVIFDCLTLDEFTAGHSPVPYMERYNRLTSEGHEAYMVANEAPGTYGCPQELANKVVAAGGYDGVILRDPQGTWTAGSGTTGEIIKIKRVLSFDLEVIGLLPGKGKHEGRMGALQVDFGGKVLQVGTGFSDSQREAANDFLGKIVEVEAMDYSSDGLLREPRFKGIRHDKLEPDTIAA